MDDHDYRRIRRRPGPPTDFEDITAIANAPTPLLARLPTELHLAISSHLGFYNTYALRLTIRYPPSILPPPVGCGIVGEKLDEAEASYVARSYGLAACSDCQNLELSWLFYCWWFDEDRSPNWEGYGQCTGCEPQVDCGVCGCWHGEEGILDYITVLMDPSANSKELV